MKRLRRNEETPIVPRTTDVSDSTIRAIGEADAKAAREKERKRREAAARRRRAAERLMGVRFDEDVQQDASAPHGGGESPHTGGNPLHAGGDPPHAGGNPLHAEGNRPHAEGNPLHAEGNRPHAGGNPLHADGNRPHADGNRPHGGSGQPHAPGTQSHGAPQEEPIQNSFPRLTIRRGSVLADIGAFLRACRAYARAKLSSFNIEKEWVFRVLITAALVVFFAITETTFAARFPLFGETPDLMLGLVIAVAMTEGEQFGAVTGLFAGLIIDALGTAGTLPLSALLYVPVGYAVGVLTENYFTGRWPVRVLYTLAAGLPRMLLAVIVLRAGNTVLSTVSGWQMFTEILLPGYASTAVTAVLPHFAAWLSLRAFHKTRAERIR